MDCSRSMFIWWCICPSFFLFRNVAFVDCFLWSFLRFTNFSYPESFCCREAKNQESKSLYKTHVMRENISSFHWKERNRARESKLRFQELLFRSLPPVIAEPKLSVCLHCVSISYSENSVLRGLTSDASNGGAEKGGEKWELEHVWFERRRWNGQKQMSKANWWPCSYI